MPITDPTVFRDKRNDWMEVFRARRVEALRPLVTRELIEEHRANPRGPHSRNLQLVLNFVRGPAFPLEGKPFVHIRKPYQEYGIGMMTARGRAPILVDGEMYSNEREAQHAVFLRRLAAHGFDLAGLVNDHV